jgi:hypothetical protein
LNRKFNVCERIKAIKRAEGHEKCKVKIDPTKRVETRPKPILKNLSEESM